MKEILPSIYPWGEFLRVVCSKMQRMGKDYRAHRDQEQCTYSHAYSSQPSKQIWILLLLYIRGTCSLEKGAMVHTDGHLSGRGGRGLSPETPTPSSISLSHSLTEKQIVSWRNRPSLVSLGTDVAWLGALFRAHSFLFWVISSWSSIHDISFVLIRPHKWIHSSQEWGLKHGSLSLI